MTAIAATFVDFRNIKGRKQLQMVFEIPVEQMMEALAILGSPNEHEPSWFAIAPLNYKPEPKALQHKEPRKLADMRLSQQAALLCEDGAFIKWVLNRADRAWVEGSLEGEQHPRTSEAAVRSLCGVLSRSEFDTHETAAARWKHLYGEWEQHKYGYTR